MASPRFRFRQFLLEQAGAAHPVGTDSVLLGAWAPADGIRTALDIGTGTGVLALMLAQRNPALRIDAVELDAASAACAERNFRASPWSERLRVHTVRIQEYACPLPEGYDLILSNPPFFSGTVVAPDPKRRLARSTIGLRLGELVEHSLRLLSDRGRVALIVPPDTGQRLQEMGAVRGLYCNRLTEVHTHPDKPVERVLLCFSRQPQGFRRERLVLFGRDGEKTPAYRGLTDAFYLPF